MSQRKSSPLRARLFVPTIAVVLFGVAPRHATAQAVQPAALTPIPTPEVPTPATPPAPHSALTAVIRAVPPAPTGPPHPVGKGTWAHGNSDHAQVLINDQSFNAVDGAEDLRAPKSQQHKQQPIDSKPQKPGRQQWIMGERLRVANEAARREADRMINAASPMDWRNRYSSD
jgi:hypothetical protein